MCLKKLFIPLLVLFFGTAVTAQMNFTFDDFEPEGEYENIHAKKIFSNEHTTTFCIWINMDVALQTHEKHTEQVYVVSGKGRMRLGDKMLNISKGDFFIIPPGTLHSVVVTSKKPLKVISIQSPEFFGKDRVLH